MVFQLNQVNTRKTEILPGPIISACMSRMSLSLRTYLTPIVGLERARKGLTIRRSLNDLRYLSLENLNDSGIQLDCFAILESSEKGDYLVPLCLTTNDLLPNICIR